MTKLKKHKNIIMLFNQHTLINNIQFKRKKINMVIKVSTKARL